MSLPDHYPALEESSPYSPPGPRLHWRFLQARLGPWEGVRMPLLASLGLGVLAAIFEVLAPSLLGGLIDALGGSSRAVPWAFFVAYAAALLLSVVFDRLSDLAELTVAGKIQAQVHTRLLADALLAPEAPARRPGATERAARLMQASAAAGELARAALIQPVRTGLAVVATAAAAAWFDPWFGVASFVWSIALLWATISLTRAAGQKSDELQRAQTQALSHGAEVLALWSVVRAAHAQDKEAMQGHLLAMQVRARWWEKWRYGETRLTLIGAMQAGFVATVLGLALWRWKSGATSAGDVAAVVGLALALMDNLQWAGQQVTAGLSARGVLGGVLQEWPEARRRIWWPGPGIDEVSGAPADLAATLRALDVSGHSLKGLTLEIEPGERVGILGPLPQRQSLMGMLSGRIAPAEGQVQMGSGETQLPQHLVAHVVHTPRLFRRSVEENVWYGRAISALPPEISKLLAFVDGLPHGWKTTVGHNGSRLTPDQARRIVLARALLAKTPWILLDDIGSDPISESLLQDLLDCLSSHVALVVSLREPPKSGLDRIVVLNRGRVVEDGSPVDLMAHGTHLARWWSETRTEE